MGLDLFAPTDKITFKGERFVARTADELIKQLYDSLNSRSQNNSSRVLKSKTTQELKRNLVLACAYVGVQDSKVLAALQMLSNKRKML